MAAGQAWPSPSTSSSPSCGSTGRGLQLQLCACGSCTWRAIPSSSEQHLGRLAPMALNSRNRLQPARLPTVLLLALWRHENWTPLLPQHRLALEYNGAELSAVIIMASMSQLLLSSCVASLSTCQRCVTLLSASQQLSAGSRCSRCYNQALVV